MGEEEKEINMGSKMEQLVYSLKNMGGVKAGDNVNQNHDCQLTNKEAREKREKHWSYVDTGIRQEHQVNIIKLFLPRKLFY